MAPKPRLQLKDSILRPPKRVEHRSSRVGGIDQNLWRLYAPGSGREKGKLGSGLVKSACAFTPLMPNELVPAILLMQVCWHELERIPPQGCSGRRAVIREVFGQA